jgi:hypothetical protein
MVNPRHVELETAKEILGEIFHARPTDVDDIIKRRLAENSWTVEQTPEDGLWPVTFCLGEYLLAGALR